MCYFTAAALLLCASDSQIVDLAPFAGDRLVTGIVFLPDLCQHNVSAIMKTMPNLVDVWHASKSGREACCECPFQARQHPVA